MAKVLLETNLDVLLRGFTRQQLDDAESLARSIIGGRRVRVTNATPRGMCISEERGRKVLAAVLNEQTRRCGL